MITGALALILSLLTMHVFAQMPDFTGHWKRNDAQCDAGSLSMNSIPGTVEISKDSQAIYIKGTLKKGDSIIHVSLDTLAVDGSKRLIKHAASQKQIGLTWSPGQGGFAVDVTITDAQGVVMQHWNELYSLSPDGKSLKIGVDLEMDGEDYHMDEVFDR